MPIVIKDKRHLGNHLMVALHYGGPLTFAQIAAQFRCREDWVGSALGTLERVHYVQHRINGGENLYTLTEEGIRQTLAYLDTL